MRIRFEKRKKREAEFKAVSGTRFAWFPTRLSNGTWVWLEKYRIGVFRSGPPRPETDSDPVDYPPASFAGLAEFGELRDAG